MPEAFIVEVTGESFDVEVVERSHQVPVLVDFWAPWCGPCRMLAPALERLALGFGGRFILAKANTEAHPAVGQRFSVSSIPACKLFIDGRVAAEFVGAISETQIRRFLESNLPTAADKLVSRARGEIAAGERARARSSLDEALAQDEKHPDAHLLLARLALHARDADAVSRHLDALDPGTDAWIASDTVRDAIRFITACDKLGDETALRAKAQEDDLDARYALGCFLALEERWEEALQTLLAVVQSDRKHANAAARKAMVTIFDLIGRTHELSDTYVRQLQIYA